MALTYKSLWEIGQAFLKLKSEIRLVFLHVEVLDDLAVAARVIHGLTIAVGDSQLLPYLNSYFQAYDEEVPVERTLEAMVILILEGIGRRQGNP